MVIIFLDLTRESFFLNTSQQTASALFQTTMFYLSAERILALKNWTYTFYLSLHLSYFVYLNNRRFFATKPDKLLAGHGYGQMRGLSSLIF